MAISNSGFEEVRIGVRLKISALWIGMLFLFAYGDIFGFFRRGVIEDVIAGKVSGIAITQVFLFAVSLYIAIASMMVFLSLVLIPTVTAGPISFCQACTSSPSWPRRSAKRRRTTGS